MALAKRVASEAFSRGNELSAPFIQGLFAPIEDLLASGGDQRIQLSRPSRRNMYGCTPYPRPQVIDFASSTASSISEEAYARVLRARDEYLAAAIRDGAEIAFENSIDKARRTLLELLGLQDASADVIFAASGTDAQLQALFLARNLLGTPLTTIIVGADQAGSGTGYTACGQHFSHVTAGRQDVEKGLPIAGLADGVRNLAIPFGHPKGGLRNPDQMDDAVMAAVETSVAGGTKVLLQIMDASKFGWRAPSDACIAQIVRRWPDQVQIVVDACQLRLSRDRVRQLLAKNCMILVTGSKFFTGPAFSGALLVPARLGATAARAGQVPAGLSAYASRYDWPRSWTALRSAFPTRANFGQWLRWEAALEEMRLYYAVPGAFREETRATLAGHIDRLVAASPYLKPLSYDGAGNAPERATLFPVVPFKHGKPLSANQCAQLYQLLRCDLSFALGASATEVQKAAAARLCQIGQPVALHRQEGSALRIGVSARLLRQCWSPEPDTAKARIDGVVLDLAALVEKLNFIIHNIENIPAP